MPRPGGRAHGDDLAAERSTRRQLTRCLMSLEPGRGPGAACLERSETPVSGLNAVCSTGYRMWVMRLGPSRCDRFSRA
jgi:hypothetical protein